MAETPEPEQTESATVEAEQGEAPHTVMKAMLPPWVRQAAWVVFIVAGATFLLLAVLYFRSYGSFDAAPESPRIALAILLAVAAGMAAAVIVLSPEQGTLRALVATSAAWSVTLLVAVIASWGLIANVERHDAWKGTPVKNTADLDVYLAAHVPPGTDPILIPTGVMLKSLEFLNGDNVQVSGYYWQKFGPDFPDDVVRGLVPAEAVRDAYRQVEAYRYTEDGVETIGWYFETILRQPFQYAEYPFDEQDVWMRLWARDFTKDIVLVPDFASYVSNAPQDLPGIEKEFVYSGWTPVYSGFTLSLQQYDSSYGIGSAAEFGTQPELYFNFILDRDFGGPFFEHFVFALAVAILLFGLLILTTDDESLKARFQLSTAGVLGACSGLLFAVILKHNQMRTIVGSRGVSYVEFIPIMLYFLIIWVVLNAILLASPYKLSLVHSRNNLWPVLVYWPFVLGSMLIVTLLVFFRH